MTALVQRPPVAGGLDVDLPGTGVRLRATRWPGRGLPVLLLHGLASTRRFWDLVVPELGGLSVLALDQRGHGDSERPDGPYDGAAVVRDALTALDALGVSRALVVGHSWGATTALRLAAEAPERVLA
ncbi:MAG: alpha/beta hydrolase, partial [Actinomycetota bacterium]|nr:alpha/beta hydrolase [Actinomycetota bacterium]